MVKCLSGVKTLLVVGSDSWFSLSTHIFHARKSLILAVNLEKKGASGSAPGNGNHPHPLTFSVFLSTL